MPAALKALAALAVILALTPACVFSEKRPMKPYTNVNIPDGEFLHYTEYAGGEKCFDAYYVTKIISNGNKRLYQTFIDITSPTGNKKLKKNYLDWPISMIFDPSIGSSIESSGTLSTNDMKMWEQYGYGGLLYWHYRYFPERGYAEYESKKYNKNNKQVFYSHYKINIKAGYSAFDAFSDFLITRFMDPGTKGIFYVVMPEFVKDPLASSYRLTGIKGKMTTKAGTFNVIKIVPSIGDPFIGKLMDPLMGSASFWIENSDRRFSVKTESPSISQELVEVSNVNR